MGLFGKSKKEIERENEDIWYQENYGISKTDSDFIARSLRCCFSTDNLDLLLRLRAPVFNDTIREIYKELLENKQALKDVESKYDTLLEAVNKQNKLLSVLVERISDNQTSLHY